MKVKHLLTACTVLALVFITISVFAAQIYQQSIFSYSYASGKYLEINSGQAGLNAITINQYVLLGITPTISVQAPAISQTILVNSTRFQIYDYINQNPGLQFRALCSALAIPVGLAEYHLGVLVRSGLVSFVRDGRYKRFFVSKRFSKREMEMICLLRHRTAKRIVQTLLSKRELSHSKLAGEVAITSQALTWQMKTLGATEFLLQVNVGLKTIYSLDESCAPMLQKCLAVVE